MLVIGHNLHLSIGDGNKEGSGVAVAGRFSSLGLVAEVEGNIVQASTDLIGFHLGGISEVQSNRRTPTAFLGLCHEPSRLSS